MPPRPSPASRTDEFPPDAQIWPEEFSRREFLELAAGTVALAGLAGCNRFPEKTIVPYVAAPDRSLQGKALSYATAMPWEGYARGLLALSRSGRPTKLEGNPAHPDSLGATDAITQASVLSLYDPDRSKTPLGRRAAASWDSFEDEWLERHRELDAARGAGFALLTEPTTSPTCLRLIHRLLDRWPRARWYQHNPLARFDQGGRQEDYDFGQADIVLGIDSDFLYELPSSLRYGRAFAARRRIEGGRVRANRFYSIDPTPTVTSSMADHRMRAGPDRQRFLLGALETLLSGRPPPPGLEEEESRVLQALARDLREHAPRILCLAGPYCDPDLRAWAAACNQRFRSGGVTLHSLPAVRSDGDPRCAGDLAAACRAMEAGAVATLAIVGSNPVFTAPRDLDVLRALASVKYRIHLGPVQDETAAVCEWHIPESHYLEGWGDLRAYGGTATVLQPLISPLYLSRSALELIDFLAEPPGRPGYDLVRETWQAEKGHPADFDRQWEEWLNAGVVPGTESPPGAPPPAPAAPAFSLSGEPPRLPTILLRPDPYIRDGRWANSSWLQELPKPINHLVWDNAALVGPAFARAHGLSDGNRLALRSGEVAMTVPVWILPGQSSEAITIYLGYGRSRAGNVGNGKGFDPFPFRRTDRLWEAELSGMKAAEGEAFLVTIQKHFETEGRDIVRVASVADLAASEKGPPMETGASLYPPVHYRLHKWGMSIDLGTCIGCQACVVACQAENNIPVVGKYQASRGRHMHWLRVDTYFDGGPDDPRILHQPVPCQQCENAPCELVCPVAATVHSNEGLNDMNYQRCVGTRFCSNNCPYKVRRFNFLHYVVSPASPEVLQFNPEVSVRARGVMEKCTYCVQRIDDGRIAAERENRPIRDGEIRTACQQACPVNAIVFGDLNDPSSEVLARKSEVTHYALLDDLNTRPRTTYLARTLNPAPKT